MYFLNFWVPSFRNSSIIPRFQQTQTVHLQPWFQVAVFKVSPQQTCKLPWDFTFFQPWELHIICFTCWPPIIVHWFYSTMTIVYIRIPVTKRNLFDGTSKWILDSKSKGLQCKVLVWTSLNQHAARLVQDPDTHKSLRNDPVLSYLRLSTKTSMKIQAFCVSKLSRLVLAPISASLLMQGYKVKLAAAN